jgi:hypothetical protein
VPDVLITFHDGEVLRADAPLIDFHQPILVVSATELRANNREVTIPLSSIKFLVFGGEEATAEPGEETSRVVIHFSDHDIMRAYAGRNVLGGPYGIIYTLWDAENMIRRQIGIPYNSVKAIFKVRRWDSRAKSEGPTYARVARILSDREDHERAERAGRPTARKRKTPLLDRTAKEKRKK